MAVKYAKRFVNNISKTNCSLNFSTKSGIKIQGRAENSWRAYLMHNIYHSFPQN